MYIFSTGPFDTAVTFDFAVFVSVSNFIKYVSPEVHKDYVCERFFNKDRTTIIKKQDDIRRLRKPQYLKDTPFVTLKKVSQLKSNHPLKRYIESRKIPRNSKFVSKTPWMRRILKRKFVVEHHLHDGHQETKSMTFGRLQWRLSLQ